LKIGGRATLRRPAAPNAARVAGSAAIRATAAVNAPGSDGGTRYPVTSSSTRSLSGSCALGTPRSPSALSARCLAGP